MTPNSSQSTSLRDYLRVLSAQKWLILAITAIAVAAGVAYTLLKTPTYDATAQVEFKNPSAQATIVTPGSQVLPEINEAAAAAAASRAVTSDDVVKKVQKSLDNGMTTDELRGDVEATVQQDSNLVAIKASTDDKDLSAKLANEFALQTKLAQRDSLRAEYASQAKSLNDSIKNGDLDPATELAEQQGLGRLETLSRVADPVDISRPATVPSSPSSPKPVRDIGLALILGLLLGIGTAFLRNALDRRITDSHQIQHDLGLPLVGYVRADALGLAGIGRNGDSFVSEDDLEGFRILRANVDFLVRDQDLRSLVVTSALPEEGKSTVAAWYAYVSAVSGRRTLLVECDFRRPVLADRFGVDRTPGLSDYLAGEAEPKDVLRSVSVHGREAVDVLPLITAGGNVFQPTEMIGSKKFKAFVDQTTRAYDVVIFDSAPLLPVGDTLELIPQVDGVILCVRLGQTTRDQALAAQQAMQHLPERPTGLVVTGVRRGSDDDYYGYYSYSSAGTAASTG
jgi:capsular exopolysaccharide synthesis family protein